jgi:hypothetical protein
MLALMTMAGCSAVQVSQDYDPQADLSPYGSWQWQDRVQPSTGDIRVDNPLLDKRIRRAIENHLAGRNIVRTDTQPELLLSYHLAIEQKIRSDTYPASMGFGGYYPYYPWYGGIGTETQIRQYEQSRLTIDIHAADTGDLLWRGEGVYRQRIYPTPQEAAAALQHVVDKILKQFPPNQKVMS